MSSDNKKIVNRYIKSLIQFEKLDVRKEVEIILDGILVNHKKTFEKSEGYKIIFYSPKSKKRGGLDVAVFDNNVRFHRIRYYLTELDKIIIEAKEVSKYKK